MNTPWKSHSTYDAVIVGARVAGASTALLLTRMGLRVLVVDRARLGADTLSTHALMRGGVLQLHRWGVLPEVLEAGTPPIRRTSFHYDNETIAIPIKSRNGIDALVAPRRTVLDLRLAGAARRAGADVAHGVNAIDLIRDDNARVRGIVVAGQDGAPIRIETGIVIGADGIRSRVARLAGAEVELEASHASGVIYGYWPGLALDGSHWYYRPGVSVGAIPTNDGLTCIFVAMPSPRFLDDLPGGLEPLYRQGLGEGAPDLAAAVGRAEPAGRLFSFPGLPGFLRRPWGPGWALVGDAGYFRDPITAHGITDALRDAESLARAVARGSDAALGDYRASRDAGALGILRVSDEIASFAWDLDRVKELHLELSRLMSAEAERLASLDPVELPSPDRVAVT